MTTPTFRFAVIGFGRRGRYHMDSLEAMEDATVRCVAVADPRDPTAEDEERFGPAFYNDYRQMLADTPDLDFVLVASYAVDHVEHALAALQRGIPVFLEKAVAFSWEETVALYQEVVRHNYPLFIGFNLRRFPATLAMKRIIDEGRLGRIQSVLGHVNTGNRWSQGVWSHFRTPPSSTLVEGKLTHDTDTIQHCLGAEVLDCTATITRNIWTEGDDRPMTAGDACSISGLLSNGVLYTLHLTTSGPDYERRYIVNGTEGQVEVVMHSVRAGQTPAAVTLWRNGEEPQSIELPPAVGGHGGADFRIHRDFVAWLRSNPTGAYDPRSILTGMIIPFAAQESMATGRRIDCAARLRQAVAGVNRETSKEA